MDRRGGRDAAGWPMVVEVALSEPVAGVELVEVALRVAWVRELGTGRRCGDRRAAQGGKVTGSWSLKPRVGRAATVPSLPGLPVRAGPYFGPYVSVAP